MKPVCITILTAAYNDPKNVETSHGISEGVCGERDFEV